MHTYSITRSLDNFQSGPRSLKRTLGAGEGSMVGKSGPQRWQVAQGQTSGFHHLVVLLQPQLPWRWFPTPLPSIWGLLLWQGVSRQALAPGQPGLPADHCWAVIFLGHGRCLMLLLKWFFSFGYHFYSL